MTFCYHQVIKHWKVFWKKVLEKLLDIRDWPHIQQIAAANLLLTVLKFNEHWGLCYGFSIWNFLENFQNSFVKEQLNIHAVGTFEETDGLLKDLIRSGWSLVMHKICKFKTFYFLMRCYICSSDTYIVDVTD